VGPQPTHSCPECLMPSGHLFGAAPTLPSLCTPPGGCTKAFVMADASQHLRVQAKLKELIERASSAADANLHRRIRPYPLGFAVRANGSKFAFEPVNIADNDAVVALIRTLFLQHKTASQGLPCVLLVCCARAASGHATAAPPSSEMNSRRFMCGWPPPGKRKCSVPHRSRLQSCVRPVGAVRVDCWP
jgi:hypothetical protein